MKITLRIEVILLDEIFQLFENFHKFRIQNIFVGDSSEKNIKQK